MGGGDDRLEHLGVVGQEDHLGHDGQGARGL
jgi:hypothetical protein